MRTPLRPSDTDENYVVETEPQDAPSFMLAVALIGGALFWGGLVLLWVFS